MGRSPCCENKGLKKGQWTAEEDQLLVSCIRRFGHPNWRALPKLAGLARCGKSCRLRWMNYLRPDIKRGNFSPEEEDAILRLHASLGNKWSAIAAELPGRTDNEIKNVWHTHLKKRASPRKIDRGEPSCGDLSSSSSSCATEDGAQLLPELLAMDDDEWWSEALFRDTCTSYLGSSRASSEGRTDASSAEGDDNFWVRLLMATEFPDSVSNPSLINNCGDSKAAQVT